MRLGLTLKNVVVMIEAERAIDAARGVTNEKLFWASFIDDTHWIEFTTIKNLARNVNLQLFPILVIPLYPKN